MFVYLSKLLPIFVYPLGLGCLLLLSGLLLYRRPRLQKAALILALLVLWAGGNRFMALGLARSLEWRYLPPPDLPKAEAIVVLGGGTNSQEPPRPIVEVNGAGDRVIYAAYLYRQGSAPYLLLSGGNIDWLGEHTGTPAEDMARLLELMDVPASAMWLQPDSRNTYEDAVFSKKILDEKGIHRIVLVTSALHMPRAVGLFEHQGLEVIPAPTDFNVTQKDWQNLLHAGFAARLISLLPGAGNLNMTSNALKEYFGLWIYHLQGWL
jgi:uncharacterized SAM-binding protein YcdF (DUF218 family)